MFLRGLALAGRSTAGASACERSAGGQHDDHRQGGTNLAAPASAQCTRPTYEQCYQLGLAREFTPSVGDWRNLEQFIRECMAGKVPFQLKAIDGACRGRS